MSRRWILLLLIAGVAPALAQQKAPKEQDPPEEDERLAVKEYSFNPLQAEQELKVGNYYFKKGSYRAAALRFEEATKWDPNMAEAFKRLGEAKEKQHDRDAAAVAYKKFLEIAPDDGAAKEIQKRLTEIQAKLSKSRK